MDADSQQFLFLRISSRERPPVLKLKHSHKKLKPSHHSTNIVEDLENRAAGVMPRLKGDDVRR